MSDAIITFPMLGDWFSIDPTRSFTILGRPFYWYGVIIAVGFILAVLYCSKRCAQFGITSDDFIDTLILAVPLGIICARAYYVIFYFDQYRDNLVDIFKIWEGGLAIYGGVIGGVLGIIIMCSIKKISIGAMCDVSSYGLLIGQAIGRWGNFINREAYGRVTDAFCRMGLTDPGTGATMYVHPCFLYESLWNALGLLILHIYSKKKQRRFDGQIFLMYVGWYGLGRMFIEGLRTDSLYLPNSNIRVSQLLAAASVLAVLIIFFINRVFFVADPDKLWVNRQKARAAAAEVGDGSAVEVAVEEIEDAPTVSVIKSDLPDDQIVDEPVVEPIEVVLHDENEENIKESIDKSDTE